MSPRELRPPADPRRIEVRLRPLAASDHDAFVAVAGDPLIWAEHPEADRATPEKVKGYFADALASGGGRVVTNTDGEVIGSSRFEEAHEDGNSILVDHTFLARPYWGSEDYTEVKGLLFDHAFTAYETVQLRIGVDNARTRAAVEELLGAVHVDTVPTPLGDHAVYEPSRTAWAERAAAP
ncbi:MAG: GCN5-related N-acetyltransferase [Solirubrobacterales bacterium]|nr:GCN5-related N-acetyltransferase [Solirubrobacterales bacterium]